MNLVSTREEFQANHTPSNGERRRRDQLWSSDNYIEKGCSLFFSLAGWRRSLASWNCWTIVFSSTFGQSSYILCCYPWEFTYSLLAIKKLLFVQVMCVYITGHLNTVFPTEHCKEILRYIYCHQVRLYVLV